MANGTRRNGYIYNRVLIEASRVLETEQSDAVVFLTGAHLEMLRNVTQYLSRRDTYVTEYEDGYYITPSDEDYDTILGIVADMEEALMGNQNVIWGYNDRWAEHTEHTVVGDGAMTLDTPAVPSGYVFTLQAVVCRNLTTAGNTIPKIQAGAVLVSIGQVVLTNATELRILDGLNYTMKEGDYVRVRFYDALDGDEIEIFTWGYKMIVPEE